MAWLAGAGMNGGWGVDFVGGMGGVVGGLRQNNGEVRTLNGKSGHC